ncbi:MAG: VTT domain-containing protein [Chloroflexota bacterium]
MEKRQGFKKRIIPLLMLLLVIAIMAIIFLYRDKVAALGNYGYLGAFLICLVCNATIILPAPGFLMLFALGATFNPILIGLAGATGGTIGELTSYLLGYSGRGVIENRKLYDHSVQWLRKWGVMTIFVFAVTPLPFDVMGMVAGLLRFPIWKLTIALWFGKVLKYTSVSLAGAYGWEAILRFFGW